MYLLLPIFKIRKQKPIVKITAEINGPNKKNVATVMAKVVLKDIFVKFMEKVSVKNVNVEKNKIY